MPRGSGPLMMAPGLDFSNVREPTATSVSEAENRQGSLFQTDDGREYKYYRANEAIATGAIVVLLNNDDNDVDAAASDNTLTATGDFTAAEFDDLEFYVATNAGTGPLQVRRIISNTADVLTLDDAWTTAIDATTDYVTFSSTNVEEADSANERVVGVAISAITASEFSWCQIRGFCPRVLAAGDTDAIVKDEGLVSSAAAGVAKGLTTSTTADEADKRFGWALIPSVNASVAARGIPAYVKCAV